MPSDIKHYWYTSTPRQICSTQVSILLQCLLENVTIRHKSVIQILTFVWQVSAQTHTHTHWWAGAGIRHTAIPVIHHLWKQKNTKKGNKIHRVLHIYAGHHGQECSTMGWASFGSTLCFWTCEDAPLKVHWRFDFQVDVFACRHTQKRTEIKKATSSMNQGSAEQSNRFVIIKSL